MLDILYKALKLFFVNVDEKFDLDQNDFVEHYKTDRLILIQKTV